MPGARDGQLRVRRGDDSPPWALQMFDDDLGLWLTLAQADVEEDAMRAGIPILRGPYVVDFTDIPHDGDTLTLWTPQVGDVLLRLFPDVLTVVQWDSGQLGIGPGVVLSPPTNVLALANAGTIARGPGGDSLDFLPAATQGLTSDGASTSFFTTGYVFGTTDPVQIRWRDMGPGEAGAGHVELYVLVARAVAP